MATASALLFAKTGLVQTPYTTYYPIWVEAEAHYLFDLLNRVAPEMLNTQKATETLAGGSAMTLEGKYILAVNRASDGMPIPIEDAQHILASGKDSSVLYLGDDFNIASINNGELKVYPDEESIVTHAAMPIYNPGGDDFSYLTTDLEDLLITRVAIREFVFIAGEAQGEVEAARADEDAEMLNLAMAKLSVAHNRIEVLEADFNSKIMVISGSQLDLRSRRRYVQQ
jgi:hypothetical protein